MRNHTTAWVFLLLLVACAPLAGPTLPPAIAQSFAQRPMRRLSARGLELYYPAEYKDAATRIARRLASCLDQLRPKAKAPELVDPVVVLLTTAEFNNAFVAPLFAGSAPFMVVPLHASSEAFHFMGLGVGHLGDVACHEAVHFVQLAQARGFWGFMNGLFGGLLTPQVFHERFFLEGLATYYEGNLGLRVGRPKSAIWRGMFASGAGAGLDVADLGETRKTLPFGGVYLTGMHFVEYLAEHYGEEKLWAVTDLQARSWASFLGVSLRFKWVYGKSIGALFDEFSEHLLRTLPRRRRPRDQHVLARDLGYFARLAGSPSDGATAILAATQDDVVRLTVREKDGRVRFSRPMVPLLPVRSWITMDPLEVSGMSFSADGRRLYLVSVNVGLTEQVSRLLCLDAQTGADIRSWELPPSLGGGVSPDGQSYVYVRMDADRGNLWRLDLATSQNEALTHFAGAESLGAPAISPDGKNIAFARWVGQGFDLFLRRDNGEVLPLTEDGLFNYSPRWVSAERLVFLREHEARAQVHLFDLTTGTITRMTDAPHVAFDPAPMADGTVVFLNRDGWGWTLDQAPAKSLGAIAAQATYATELTETRPSVYPEPELIVAEDTPYSSFDHLFLPSLHAPLVYFVEEFKDGQRVRTRFFAGLSLAGQDRLRLHSWAADALYGGDAEHMQLRLHYGTNVLAPLWLQAAVAWAAEDPTTDRSAQLVAQRVFYDTPVALTFSGLERRRDETKDAQATLARVVGPGLHLRLAALDGTDMAGITRGLALSLDTSAYPSFLGSQVHMADLRGQVDAFLPLPILSRHSFVLSLTGRWLPGADVDLLQVGGIPDGKLFVGQGHRRSDGVDRTLGLGLGFSEYVRGYEDHPFFGTDLVLGSAVYRVPWIIDKGVASLLYLLPSVTLRQLDLQLFGTWATSSDDGAGPHRAAGAALAAQIQVLFVPLKGYYQYAHRFDDGLADLHLVGLALGL